MKKSARVLFFVFFVVSFFFVFKVFVYNSNRGRGSAYFLFTAEVKEGIQEKPEFTGE